jgi:hypothetical protein
MRYSGRVTNAREQLAKEQLAMATFAPPTPRPAVDTFQQAVLAAIPSPGAWEYLGIAEKLFGDQPTQTEHRRLRRALQKLEARGLVRRTWQDLPVKCPHCGSMERLTERVRFIERP